MKTKSSDDYENPFRNDSIEEIDRKVERISDFLSVWDNAAIDDLSGWYGSEELSPKTMAMKAKEVQIFEKLLESLNIPWEAPKIDVPDDMYRFTTTGDYKEDEYYEDGSYFDDVMEMACGAPAWEIEAATRIQNPHIGWFSTSRLSESVMAHIASFYEMLKRSQLPDNAVTDVWRRELESYTKISEESFIEALEEDGEEFHEMLDMIEDVEPFEMYLMWSPLIAQGLDSKDSEGKKVLKDIVDLLHPYLEHNYSF